MNQGQGPDPNQPNPPAANPDLQAILAAITGIGTAITNALAAQAGGAGGAPPVPPAVVTNLHFSATPYDLNTRHGLAAHTQAGSALTHKYDGFNATYPNFLNELLLRARTYNWDAKDATTGDVEPTNIITFGTAPNIKNVFNDIQALTEAELTAARVAFAGNPRAVQNDTCLYECLSKSVEGNLHALLFSQPGNLPTLLSGILLFKKIASFTTLNTLPTAVATTDLLSNLNPATYDFNIIKVNDELNRLFVVGAQGPMGPIINDAFKVLQILRTYDKIKRPAEWFTFVQDLKRQNSSPTMRLNPILICAEAVAKYQECESFTGRFAASLETLDESVVAMMAKLAKQQTTKKIKTKKEDSKPAGRKPKGGDSEGGGDDAGPPPFLTHTRKSRKDGGAPYKEGDTKTHGGKTYHYHPATNHRDNKRWFVHTAAACLTCRKFKQQEKTNDDGKDDDAAKTSAISDLTQDSDVQTLLAAAFDKLEGTPKADVIQALLADAIQAIQDA